MSLRSPAENENAGERFLAWPRNDDLCYLEPSAHSESNVREIFLYPCFEIIEK
jgi:hypothetical protein